MMLAVAAAMCAAGLALIGSWALDHAKTQSDTASPSAMLELSTGPGLSPETVTRPVENTSPDQLGDTAR